MPILSVVDSWRRPSMKGLLVILLLSLHKDSFMVSVNAAATTSSNSFPSIVSAKESVPTRKNVRKNENQDILDLFPAVYTLDLSQTHMEKDSYLQEQIAKMDITNIRCNSSSLVCRLTTLIHSETQHDVLHSHSGLDLRRDHHATSNLLHNRRKEQRQQQYQQRQPSRRLVGRGMTSSNTTKVYPRMDDFPCFLSYEGTIQWIEDLVDQYEGKNSESKTNHDDDATRRKSSLTIRNDVTLSWMDIGDSYLKTQNSKKGHNIYALKIGSRRKYRIQKETMEKRAPLLILTGVHPREYSPPEAVRLWIKWLITTKTDLNASILLETTDVYWIPYVNPDGRVLAETTETFRRKNVRGTESSSSSMCDDETSVGVDLNRNFPFRYGLDSGSSSYPCDSTYRGSGPASEPEIQAVIGFGESIFPESQRFRPDDDQISFMEEGIPLRYNHRTTKGVFLDLHSYGNMYIYPWGFENVPSPNHLALTAIAHKLSHFSGYDITGPGEGFTYPASGASDDWAYATLGAAAMTWELGTSFQEDCKNFRSHVVPDSLNALTYAAMLAHLPFHLSKGPDIVEFAIRPQRLKEGRNLTVSVRASDKAYSNPSLVLAASQKVKRVLFFLDINPYAAIRRDKWKSAADWELNEDDLNQHSRGNWTMEYSFASEVFQVRNQSQIARHVLYAVAIDEDGYSGVLSAVRFRFVISKTKVSQAPSPTDNEVEKVSAAVLPAWSTPLIWLGSLMVLVMVLLN